MAYLCCMDLILLHIFQHHAAQATVLVVCMAIGNSFVVRPFFGWLQSDLVSKGGENGSTDETSMDWEGGADMENVGASQVDWSNGSLFCGSSKRPTVTQTCQQPTTYPAESPLHFVATSVYQDFNRSSYRVIFTFLGQFLLAWFYLLSLQENHEEEVAEEEKTQRRGQTASYKYAFWTVGVVVVQLGVLLSANSSGSFGSTFEGTEWWRKVFNAQYCLTDGLKVVPLSSAGKYTRFPISFLANSLLRDIVLFTVPLFLMESSTPMEVVMNVAVTYLTNIDDVGIGQRYILVSFKRTDQKPDLHCCGGKGLDDQGTGSTEGTYRRLVSLPVVMLKRRESKLEFNAQTGQIQSVGDPCETFKDEVFRKLD